MDTKLPGTLSNAGPIPAGDPALHAAIRRGHELMDVNVRGLFIFVGGLLVSLVMILLGLGLAFKGFQRVDRRLTVSREKAEPGAGSKVRSAPVYAGPLLQVRPEEDLAWMKSHADTELNTYGWINRPAGVVRLPIDRAMDLLVERGLPPTSPGLTFEALQRARGAQKP